MKRLQSLSKLRIGLVAAALTAVAGLGLLQYASAAGQLRLTPGSGSVQNGNNISVSIRISPDQPVDGVEATVSYDESKLQFVSVDASNSALPMEIVQTGGNGTVEVTRAHMTGTVSGDSLVAVVTFKALVGSGSTNLQITGNAVGEAGYINPGFENATITFTSPAPSSDGGSQQPPSSDGGSSGGSSGSGGGSSSGSGSGGRSNTGSGNKDQSSDKKDDKVKSDMGLEVHKKRVEFTKVVFKATAKKKVRTQVVYGLSKDQLDINTPLTEFGKEHEILLDTSLMIPGTTYYYKAIAEDEQGNKAETSVEKFKTKGLKVRLLITDSNERPIKRRKVTLHSDPITAETDDSGYATFEDVAPGNHKVEYEQGGRVHAENVTVAGDEPITEAKDGTQYAAPETIQVRFKNIQFADTSQSTIILPATIATGIALLAGVALLIVKRRQNRLNPISNTAGPNPFTASEMPQDSQGAKDDELISKVKGLDRPDPGSVVNPRHDDKDER